MSGYDAHCHLDQLSDLAGAVARAQAAGVTGWCLAAADPADWEHLRGVAAQTGGQVALGVHPWWVTEHWAAQLARLPTSVDAIGETGLDHRCGVDRRLQRESLRGHLALARDRNLPVVLHCVKAVPELLQVLKRDGVPTRGGLVHAWTGDAQQTQEITALGLHVSVGTDLLRWPSPKLADMVRAIPAHRLLIETDAPERPLAQGLGEPADLVLIAEAVAQLRGGTAAVWLAQTGASARALLA